MKVFLLCILFMVQTNLVSAQEKKVTDLPNISVIGSFDASSTKDKKEFNVTELEFAFQHYLYPSVKADIFLGLHKNDKGKRELELEEGYVTFTDVSTLILPNQASLGVGMIVGKKLIGIGKINPTHKEQWFFIDKPLAHKTFFGSGHGLSAEGAQFQYLLPLPFFSQASVGYWTAQSEAHGEEAHEGIEYKNRILNARSWNSFALSQSQELELGLNYLLGNASSSTKDEQPEVLGLDLTFTQQISANQSLTIAGEFFETQYAEEAHEGEEEESGRKKQTGGFLSAWYKLNQDYQFGARYATLGKHGDEGSDNHAWSYMVTKQLTDTSKFKLQLNTGSDEDTMLASFIFGMGPHSHVLN